MKKVIALSMCVWMLLVLFPLAACAEIGSEAFSIEQQGDRIVATYRIPNALDEVGSISFELFYDAGILRAEDVQAEPVSGVEGVAPDANSTGRIGISWTDYACSMETEAGQKLVEVRFTVLDGAAGAIRLSPSIEIVGGDMGMEDYTAQSGAVTEPLYLEYAGQTVTEISSGEYESLRPQTAQEAVSVPQGAATPRAQTESAPQTVPGSPASSTAAQPTAAPAMSAPTQPGEDNTLIGADGSEPERPADKSAHAILPYGRLLVIAFFVVLMLVIVFISGRKPKKKPRARK